MAPAAGGSRTGWGWRLPFAHRRLDYLVVANPRQEEIRALTAVIERFPPQTVL